MRTHRMNKKSVLNASAMDINFSLRVIVLFGFSEKSEL
jgi:hypothetical protein